MNADQNPSFLHFSFFTLFVTSRCMYYIAGEPNAAPIGVEPGGGEKVMTGGCGCGGKKKDEKDKKK